MTNSMDFGQEGGTPISNKDSILSDIDRALGQAGPPDVEILLTQAWAPKAPSFHWLTNRLGLVKSLIV